MLERTRKLIATELGSAGMLGIVNRRALAEHIWAKTRDSDEWWSLADKREAYLEKLTAEITKAMNEPLSEDYLQRHLSLPRQYLHLFSKVRTYICINMALGHHVLAIKATKEHWAANARIKRSLGEQVIAHADVSNDVLLALRAEGVDSIEELGLKEAA